MKIRTTPTTLDTSQYAADNRSMGVSEWMMLSALSLLWGGSFFFLEVAVDTLPPLTIVLLRVGLAAIALWIWVCHWFAAAA